MFYNLFKVIPYITIDANKKLVKMSTSIIAYCFCEIVFVKNNKNHTNYQSSCQKTEYKHPYLLKRC
jgi:hypothetical protein